MKGSLFAGFVRKVVGLLTNALLLALYSPFKIENYMREVISRRQTS